MLSRTLPSADPGAISSFALTDKECHAISNLMYSRFGIDLRNGKKDLIAARLSKNLRTNGLTTFSDYLSSVLADRSGTLLTQMVDSLTTNHTSFLREKAHFDFLVKNIWNQSSSPLRVWSAACSTGEEPYTIACQLASTAASKSYSILATDISSRVLKRAQLGIYEEDRVRELPEEWRKAFMERHIDGAKKAFKFRPAITQRIQFQKLNLAQSISLQHRFGVIFCRNVMIYFDRPTQSAVLERLVAHLEPGGYLFVGHSESLMGINHGLKYVVPAVYRKL